MSASKPESSPGRASTATRSISFWLECAFYAVNIVVFYGFVILPIGLGIRDKCSDIRGCVRRIQWSSLLPGLPVYPVDLTDGQWREFRSSLPLLSLAMFGSFALGRIYNMYLNATGKKDRGGRVYVDLLYGVALVLLQHGRHSLIVFVLLALSYLVGKLTKGTRARVGVAWAFGIFTIALKESYRVKRTYPVLNVLFDQRYGGMYSWHLAANFLVLRMISFSCDDHWAEQAVDGVKKNDKYVSDTLDNGEQGTHSEVATQHRPPIEYSFVNYVSYCLYPPLYMAGPIMTYNSYMSYVRRPAGSAGILLYGVRFLFCLIVIESGLSYFPMFSVVSCGLFWDLSPVEMAVVAYVLLKLMWLKFLLLWRFFRLWALVDGKVPPENMTRCMSNNCSLEQFWKGWHSSFNKWLVRYMYVPMGGRKFRLVSVWFIFVFVAVWHDVEPKLLAWGVLNAVFYLVEVAGKWIYNSDTIQSSAVSSTILDGVAIFSSSTYICVLIIVNMIGYAVGIGGVKDAFHAVSGDGGGFFSTEVLVLISGVYYFLSVGVCIMRFLIRHGISKP